MSNSSARIPPEILAEQWFSFVQDFISDLQVACTVGPISAHIIYEPL